MSAEDEEATLVGQMVGRYQVCAPLARGGMAEVYLARLASTHGFKRWVALKVVREKLAGQERFVDMFHDEARLSARIQHPNVCAVLDFGEHDDNPYLVMEYLHGESLATILRAHTLQKSSEIIADMRDFVCRIVADAARGLQAAHDTKHEGDADGPGIVHRDVSPQNIVVLYEGTSKVVDFGIAKARGRLAQETTAGEVKGKFAYMSPEQLSAEEVDHRTDIWSLGVVLWEATLGKRLFRSDTEARTISRVLFDDIPKATSIDADFPETLQQILDATLVRERQLRIQTAGELADKLESYLYSRGKPIGQRQVSAWMKEQLGDRMAKRDAILAGATSVPLPENVDDSVSSSRARRKTLEGVGIPPPSVDIPVVLEENSASTAALIQAGLLQQGRRSIIGPLFAGAALVLAAVAIGVYVGRTNTGDRVAEAPADAAAHGSLTGAANAPSDTNTMTETAQGADPPAAHMTEAAPTKQAGTALTTAHVRPDGTPTAETRMTGERPPHETMSHRVRPAGPPGRLNLIAIPAARVYLGRRLLGTTPLAGVSIRAGSQRLRLESISGGEHKRVRVTIRSGELTRQVVRF